MGRALFVRLFAASLYGLLAAIPGTAYAPLTPEPWPGRVVAGAVLAGALLGFIGAPLLVTWPLKGFGTLVRLLPFSSALAALVGLATGLFLAFLLAVPLSHLPGSFGKFSPLVASLALGALGAAAFVSLERELVRLGRHLLPSLKTDRVDGDADARQILVDTSAIIDGRIADIGQSGFLQGTLVVPRFVLEELRHIADSTDTQRRSRGRRGLEVLNTLRREAIIPVQVLDMDAEGVREVDDKLVAIASRLHAPILTTDFNLNRIAELQGVQVLNVNQLASALRPVVLPGEEMTVYVQQEGKEHNQGIAFLEDGTMVVVEGGRRFIGHELEVTVTRVLQTAAGRIIFTHPRDA